MAPSRPLQGKLFLGKIWSEPILEICPIEFPSGAVLMMKKKFPIDFAKIELFSFFKPKVVNYVHFYLLYHFLDFGNKIVHILFSNM